MNLPRPLLHKTLAYYSAYIAFGFVVASQGPTIEGLADHTHSRLSQMGLVLAVRAAGYLLGVQVLGRVIDRIPGHPIMSGVLLVLCAGFFLTPLVPVLPLLMLIFFIIGVGESGLDVGGNTLLVWTHGEKSAPLLSGLHFCFGVGAFLCPIVLAEAGGLRAGYWWVALFMLPPALLIFSSASPAIQRSKHDQGELLNIPLVLLITIFFFLHVGGEVSFGQWIFTYVTRLDLMNERNASYLTSAYWGSITLGRLVGLPLAARFKPATLILADLLGCLLSMLIMGLWNSPAGAIVGTVGLGLSLASLFPVTLAFAGERMTITGKITSWFFTGNAIAGIVMPYIIGNLFEGVGERTLVWVVGLCFLIALAIFAGMNTRPTQVLPSLQLNENP